MPSAAQVEPALVALRLVASATATMGRPSAGEYSATVTHADPAFPPGAVCIVDPVAAVVIDESLKLRASHPAAPPLDVLDLVLRGRRGRPINFDDVAPVSPFGVLVVEAFDWGMPVSDWIGFYRFPDPRVIAALDGVWRKEVWPSFTAHFGIA